MNLPNTLTLSRLGLTVIFVGCFSLEAVHRFTAALVVFLIATVTDYLDGALARKRGLVTDFGKLMDPLADKILTSSAFICLSGLGAIPAWAVIVIISREFLITGLRALAAAKGVVLPAERLGKHKTAWQMITIIYFLTLLALREWLTPVWWNAAWEAGAVGLVAMTVLLTVYSGAAYLVKNRGLLETI
jgi:CDP-diacylglycerol--glycerol-3-phosphate 3-phosphatidyltransferase